MTGERPEVSAHRSTEVVADTRGGDAERGSRRPPESWRRQFDEEDVRWSTGAQWRDWLVLLGLLAVASGLFLLVFWLEPGLR